MRNVVLREVRCLEGDVVSVTQSVVVKSTLKATTLFPQKLLEVFVNNPKLSL